MEKLTWSGHRTRPAQGKDLTIMFGFGKPKTIIVKEFTSHHDLEREGNRLAKKGYTLTGVSQRTSIGAPTLTRGIIHTKTTATFQRPAH